MKNNENKTLRLTLKKKWFDMILSGEKKEEYREIKEYWVLRLLTFNDNRNDYSFLTSLPNYLQGAFWYAVGFTNSRIGAVNYLLLYYSKYRDYDFVVFKNGYSANAPEIKVEFKGIDIGKAVGEWSDNWQGDVFRIKLGNIISTVN